MTAPHVIDPAHFLSEQLEQASGVPISMPAGPGALRGEVTASVPSPVTAFTSPLRARCRPVWL
jgi:hypothetical protein